MLRSIALLIILMGILGIGKIVILLVGEEAGRYFDAIRENLEETLYGVVLSTEDDYALQRGYVLKYAREAEYGMIHLREEDLADPEVPEFVMKVRTDGSRLRSARFISIKPNETFDVSLDGDYPLRLKLQSMWLEFALRVYYRSEKIGGRTREVVFELPRILKGDTRVLQRIYEYVFWEVAIYTEGVGFDRIAVLSGRDLVFERSFGQIRAVLDLRKLREDGERLRGMKYLYIRPLTQDLSGGGYSPFPGDLRPYVDFLRSRGEKCDWYYIYGSECGRMEPNRSFMLSLYKPKNHPPEINVPSVVRLMNPVRSKLKKMAENWVRDPDGDEVEINFFLDEEPIPEIMKPGRYTLRIEAFDGKSRSEREFELDVENSPPEVMIDIRGNILRNGVYSERAVVAYIDVFVDDPDDQEIDLEVRVSKEREILLDKSLVMRSGERLRKFKVWLRGGGEYTVEVVADDGEKRVEKNLVFRVNKPPFVTGCDLKRSEGKIFVECRGRDEDGHIEKMEYTIWGNYRGNFQKIEEGSSRGGILRIEVPSGFAEYRVEITPVDDLGERGERYEEILRMKELAPPTVISPKSGEKVDPNSLVLEWKDSNAFTVEYDVIVRDIHGEDEMRWSGIKEKSVKLRGLRSGRDYEIVVIAKLGNKKAMSKPVNVRTLEKPVTFFKEIAGLKGENWKLFQMGQEIVAYDPVSGRISNLSVLTRVSKNYRVVSRDFRDYKKYVRDSVGGYEVVKDPDLDGESVEKGDLVAYFEEGVCGVAVGKNTLAILDCDGVVHIMDDDMSEIGDLYPDEPDRLEWYRGKYYVDDGKYVVVFNEDGQTVQKYGRFYRDVAFFTVGRFGLVVVDESGIVYAIDEGVVRKYPRVGDVVDVVVNDRNRMLILSKPYFLYISDFHDRRMDYTKSSDNVIKAFEICGRYFAVVTQSGVEIRSSNDLSLVDFLRVSEISDAVLMKRELFVLRRLREESEVIVMRIECY